MQQLTKGVCCCQCFSVIFDVGQLVQHLADNPSHKHWKFGDGKGALFIELMLNREITTSLLMEDGMAYPLLTTDAPTENKRSYGDSAESPKSQATSHDRIPVVQNGLIGGD